MQISKQTQASSYPTHKILQCINFYLVKTVKRNSLGNKSSDKSGYCSYFFNQKVLTSWYMSLRIK